MRQAVRVTPESLLEVLGEDGAAPFVVRGSDNEHVSRLHPGPDAYLEQPRAASQATDSALVAPT